MRHAGRSAVGCVPLEVLAAGRSDRREPSSLPWRVEAQAVDEQLVKLADQTGLTLIQLALGFVTAHPAVTSAIIGPRTLEHLDSQLAAADTALPSDVLDTIDAMVAPGLDLAPDEKIDTPPSLLDATLRRRRS